MKKYTGAYMQVLMKIYMTSVSQKSRQGKWLRKSDVIRKCGNGIYENIDNMLYSTDPQRSGETKPRKKKTLMTRH